MIKEIFRNIRNMRFHYQPLIEVIVQEKKVLENLSFFEKKHSTCRIAPVLKSNAYGHGLIPIAKIFDKKHLPFLCVDSYFEALSLRNEGITTPILILGFTPFVNIKNSKLKNVAFSILSLAELEYLSKKLKQSRQFHLEINTGMNRHGINLDEINSAGILIRGNKRIHIEGIFSHLADADSSQSQQTNEQIERWNSVVNIIRTEFPGIRFAHLAATAGSAFSERISANVIRVGLGLYGIGFPELNPVLTMKTSISSIHKIYPGQKIGYNGTFVAEKEMTIATIPAGYAEGIDLRLSNAGFVSVQNILCPFVGRVSMNIAIIDITPLPTITIGEPVTIFSVEKEAKNSIEKTAEICKTIPYEILVHIPASLRRTTL